MTIFVKRVLKFFLLLSFLCFLTIGLRVYLVRDMLWKLPEKNILFMGASHIACGIDDSVFPNALNLASGSERYMFTYLKLKALTDNNSNIDAIFLEFAPTDIWENTDVKYFLDNEMSHFIPYYYPLFSIDEWRIYQDKKKDVSSFMLGNILRKFPFTEQSYIHRLGGYSPKETEVNVDSIKVSEINQLSDSNNTGHMINYRYLNKIISLCNSKDIKLYFLYMPVFKPELYYDQEYFYKIYNKYYRDIDFWDYSNWVCPSGFRMDAHHLNKRGAIAITKDIKARFNL